MVPVGELGKLVFGGESPLTIRTRLVCGRYPNAR